MILNTHLTELFYSKTWLTLTFLNHYCTVGQIMATQKMNSDSLSIKLIA